MSATALVAAVRARVLTATRVMECHLARTQQLEATLNTYVTLDADGALRAAHDIDRRLAAGADPGPLAGLPVSVKDLIAVGGMPHVDVPATQATPVTASPVGMDVPAGHTGNTGHTGRNPVDWSHFTYPFNLSGHPCVSLPIGLASKACRWVCNSWPAGATSERCLRQQQPSRARAASTSVCSPAGQAEQRETASAVFRQQLLAVRRPPTRRHSFRLRPSAHRPPQPPQLRSHAARARIHRTAARPGSDDGH